jgi:branched-chain amino acid transport system substrate-binding protein
MSKNRIRKSCLELLCKIWVLSVFLTQPLLAQEKSVRVGFIGSLTGPDPGYGAAMRGGVETSVQEINEKGGIKGIPIEVIFEDGGCINSKGAVTAAHKLVSIDRVPAIIGGGCSNEVLSAAPIVNRNNVFLLSSGASSPTVAKAGPFILRNILNDHETSVALTSRLISEGYHHPAILSDETDYSQAIRASFLKKLGQLGIRDTQDISVLPGLSDYRSDVLKLKSKKSDALFVNPNGSAPAGLLVRQARLAGIKIPIYLAYNASETFLESAGQFAEGVMSIDLPIPESVSATKVLSNYRSQFGKDSPYPYNTVAAYDAMNIIAAALENGHNSGAAIRDYVVNLPQYNGALGTYKFGSNGSIEGLGYRFRKVVNGKWVTVQ